MVRTEVGKLGPFFLLSRRFWVNVKSHTSSLVFFPQYLMTFFEKCAVIILVCHWDLERLKQSPNDTEIANRETSVYTQVWSLFGFSMKGWLKNKKLFCHSCSCCYFVLFLVKYDVRSYFGLTLRFRDWLCSGPSLLTHPLLCSRWQEHWSLWDVARLPHLLALSWLQPTEVPCVGADSPPWFQIPPDGFYLGLQQSISSLWPSHLHMVVNSCNFGSLIGPLSLLASQHFCHL